ncbi:hypothetical protein JIP87_004276 [Salmonella enterica]|nr:hypothetical protein [Salmonella enterica]
MPNRFFVYSIFVPKKIIINHIGSNASIPNFSDDSNATTEIFLIFDSIRKVSLSYAFTDNRLALEKCNSENKGVGADYFEYESNINPENTINLNDNDYNFSCNIEHEKILKDELTKSSESRDNITDGIKKIAFELIPSPPSSSSTYKP